jgi:hypothetical protein
VTTDPITILAASVNAEVAADDDSVDAYYRLIGKSEGEISSYRWTREMMRQMARSNPTGEA